MHHACNNFASVLEGTCDEDSDCWRAVQLFDAEWSFNSFSGIESCKGVAPDPHGIILDWMLVEKEEFVAWNIFS